MTRPVCPKGINSAVCYLSCRATCTNTEMYACSMGKTLKRFRLDSRVIYTRTLRKPKGK
jgi:hypothetical protein